MRNIFIFPLLSIILACSNAAVPNNNFMSLITQVEKLNITRGTYTLGKQLTREQKKIASDNRVEHSIPGTFKFKDNSLFIIADTNSERALIIYEQYEPISVKKIQDLLGALIFDFGDPTILVHDKLLYWAYSDKAKLSQDEYQKIKESKIKNPFMATVKLSSNIPLLSKEDTDEEGSIYYIISSAKVLETLNP